MIVELIFRKFAAIPRAPTRPQPSHTKSRIYLAASAKDTFGMAAIEVAISMAQSELSPAMLPHGAPRKTSTLATARKFGLYCSSLENANHFVDGRAKVVLD